MSAIIRNGAREAFMPQYLNWPNHGKIGWLGHELELVLTVNVNHGDQHGFRYAPNSHDVLAVLWTEDPEHRIFDKEWSAQQVEVRTEPCFGPEELADQLIARAARAQQVARELGFELRVLEWLEDEGVGPPLPTEICRLEPRYQDYAVRYPERASRMFRVASGQFHVGCRDLEQALEVFSRLQRSEAELRTWADPRRIAAFEEYICPDWWPHRTIESEDDLWRYAVERGFTNNRAEDYGAIRLHPKWGTVEVRIPGPTLDRDELIRRGRRILEITGFWELLA